MDPVRVTEADGGRRLDAFVARLAGVSRAHAAQLVSDGLVTVDGERRPKSHRLGAGEVVAVSDARPAGEADQIPPPPPVVFEDDVMLVVDKPAGIVVHAAPGLREATLVDAVLATGRPLAAAAGPERPGVVHRLDRDVSGLLLLAKTDEAHAALVRAIAARTVERRYVALVAGQPEVDRGKIDAPVGPNPRHRGRMAVRADGKASVTWFDVRERLGVAALLDVRLETGRTHQIRTHLASIGHPVLGDAAYGRDRRLEARLGLTRPFLHAASLALYHPTTGEALRLDSPLPDDLERVLEAVRG